MVTQKKPSKNSKQPPGRLNFFRISRDQFRTGIDQEDFSWDTIKGIRESKLNVSQRIFAELMGVNVRTVQRWENEKNQLEPKGTARKLLHLLNKYPSVVQCMIDDTNILDYKRQFNGQYYPKKNW